MSKYFFIGIGGSGMSAIAQILAARGHSVSGSDRNFDRGLNTTLSSQLASLDIKLFPQDGSGVAGNDFVVVSTAIENTVPDMAAAAKHSIPVLHRSDLLAEIFNSGKGISAGGTSGKSTVTGITGHILSFACLDPAVINGGRMKNFETETSPGNCHPGTSDWVVIESDESDGSIVKYRPHISILTNVTKDHKTIDELKVLFKTYLSNTTGTAVVNNDCPIASSIPCRNATRVTYALHSDADLRPSSVEILPLTSTFVLDGIRYQINVPGEHNVSNALAAIAAARAAGISDNTISSGLRSFAGIRRRFDIVGEANGIHVIDDFAHNPDKIRATLRAIRLSAPRIVAIFQPHGFGPTRFMFDDLVDVFSTELMEQDVLFMPEIYFAGGTAERSISSRDITDAISARGRDARYVESRTDIAPQAATAARPGDAIAVMGARDDTLTEFCKQILSLIP